MAHRIGILALLAACGGGRGGGGAARPGAGGFPRGGRLIDLTHPFDETTLYWPTSPSGFVPAFDNLASLADLPPRGAVVIALPMKIRGGSGGPLRIVAWVP